VREEDDDVVGLGQPLGEPPGRLDPRPLRARHAGHAQAERRQSRLDGSPDRAVPDDQGVAARHLVQEHRLPAALALRVAELPQPLGRGQHRGHHPLRHRGIAGAARAAHHHAFGHEREEPFDARRHCLHHTQRRHVREGAQHPAAAVRGDHELRPHEVRGQGLAARDRVDLDLRRKRAGAVEPARLGQPGLDAAAGHAAECDA
jgi:hypothetical protein